MTSHENGSESNGSRASTSVLLDRLRVLETFTITEPVQAVTAIAHTLDMHENSVCRILAQMEQAGYMQRDRESGRFRCADR